MKDILTAPFIRELKDTTANMYRLGWDERNGGNLSMYLPDEAIQEYLDLSQVIRTLPLQFDASEIAGKIFIVTGTGKYFKNIENDPSSNLGIVRIASNGTHIEILWGLEHGAQPTCEFSTHLLNHITRLKVDPAHRVVMHCHPVNILAMTFVHDIDENAFTRTLWQMCQECIIVFPDGVGVIPWMISGSDVIGQITAEKIATRRLVVWGQHGIFGTGRNLDETFGLIETVEKAAEIYMKIAHLEIQNTIPVEKLGELATSFGITPREGIL